MSRRPIGCHGWASGRSGHNESVYQPELLRIRGQQREATDAAGAAADHHRAIELARAHGARSFEQRAQRSLRALEGK